MEKNKKNIRLRYIFKTKKGGITVQQIALAAIMLAIITVVKLTGKIIPDTPTGASWVEVYMIFAVILVLTMPFIISLLVLVTAPFLWFVLGLTTQLSPFSFLLDYSLPIISVIIVYLARFIKATENAHQIFNLKNFMIFILLTLAFMIKWVSHALSGTIFWKVPFWTSMSLNALATFTTFGVTVIAFVGLIPKIKSIQELVNNQGYRW